MTKIMASGWTIHRASTPRRRGFLAFLDGMTSSFDLAGVAPPSTRIHIYTLPRTDEQIDAAVLGRDWRAVGEELRRQCEAIERELERAEPGYKRSTTAMRTRVDPDPDRSDVPVAAGLRHVHAA